MPWFIRIPEPWSHSRLGLIPVAMITRSAGRSGHFLNLRRLFPRASSIFASVTPVRIFTPCFLSHASTSAAPLSSTIRGRMRGAISTIVSLAPSDRIEFRIVKAMNPAPTMTTWLPGVIPAMTARAWSSVQKE